MNEAVRIEEGAHLFVLDDGGVFFSHEGQELYAFNTPSTFVWCCIEEGLTAREIAAAYGRSFSTAGPDAERDVAALLHGWQDRGWISGVEGLEPPPIHFDPALAPRSDEKRASEQLRQAAEPRAEPAEIGELPSAWYTEQRYRLLTTNFQVRYETRAQQEMIHPVLAHLECGGPAGSEVRIEVMARPSGHLLLRNGGVIGESLALDELAPIVKSAFRGMAINLHRYFMEIHAAVIGAGERCLLLPAAPGSGKSTLSAALVHAGFDYLSDEMAVLEPETLAVHPAPLALAVKPGAVEVLTPYFPEVAELAVHQREDGQSVRYLVPFAPSESVPNLSLPVGWIVFPRYAPEQPTALRPTPRREALQHLMQECMLLPEPLDVSGVRRLVQWIREIPCFDLSIANSADAVEQLRSLTAFCRAGS